MNDTKVGATIPETDYLKGYKFGKAEAQAEIDKLKSKIKPRPAYDYQRKRILSLQAEIDEIVDMLKEAVKSEYMYQRMSKIVIPKMKELIAKHRGEE